MPTKNKNQPILKKNFGKKIKIDIDDLTLHRVFLSKSKDWFHFKNSINMKKK